MPEETCPCKYCGVSTPMTGTKLCDPCWHVVRAVEGNPSLARRVLAESNTPLPTDTLTALIEAATFAAETWERRSAYYAYTGDHEAEIEYQQLANAAHYAIEAAQALLFKAKMLATQME